MITEQNSIDEAIIFKNGVVEEVSKFDISDRELGFLKRVLDIIPQDAYRYLAKETTIQNFAWTIIVGGSENEF